MGSLSCRTRGNSSPQGKERVYFTCHPADFQAFFDPICEDIFKTQNCAIWYLADTESSTGAAEEKNDAHESKFARNSHMSDESENGTEPEKTGDSGKQKGIIGWVKRAFRKKSGHVESEGRPPVDSRVAETEENASEAGSGRTEAGKNTSEAGSGGTEGGKKTSTESSRTALEEELVFELGQMQLFVIPITSRFLYQPNRARDVDFKFAVEHHIPILPLMQETGLESEFNRICGDIQFLDKQASAIDLTALPYEEKLKKFLESVLLGDDLTARVRAAFDAYIFLSYRKKDRKYAQELMRLIHKNPFCRDIAIWYDEFLTPGENFNDAIRDAMEKSSLFAMVVTPNLVNEVNYVMTTEYPKAMEAGTPVLPAQMVKTNRKALCRAYPGIARDHVIDAHDESALRKALAVALSDGAIDDTFKESDGAVSGNHSEAAVKRLHGIALAETDRKEDPQHLFFIGLAYLGGIDVEMDYTRAVALIRRAAEADVPEAIQKLISMYNTGEGVRRNYNEAVQWQRKLVEHYRSCYAADRTGENADKLFWTQCHLGDALCALGKLADAKAVYAEMRDFSGEVGESYDFRRNLSISYGRLGNIAKAEGKLAEAKVYYAKVLEMLEVLAKETVAVGARRDLSVCYNNLGGIAGAEGNLVEAKTYYLKEMELTEAIAKETGTMEARRDLSVSYDMLGEIAEAEGKLAETKAYYAKAMELTEAIAKETGTVEVRRGLSVSYVRHGDIAKAEGNLEEARAYYVKGMELLEAIAKETGTVKAHSDLATCYERIGYIAEAEEKFAEAGLYYAKGFELREAIAKETGTMEARRDLGISYERLGSIDEAQGNLAEAKVYYTKGMELLEAIAKETGTMEAHRSLAVSYENHGDIAEAKGNLAEARAYYAKEMELLEALVKETVAVEVRRSLAVSYERLGDIANAEGKLAEARMYYVKSLELIEAIVKEMGTVKARCDLSISYDKLGGIARVEGKIAEAKTYYAKGMELSEAMAKETGMVKVRRNLSISYEGLGDVAEAEGKPAEARAYYAKNLELRKAIAKETGTVEARRNLSVSYIKLGGIAKTEGKLAEARMYCVKGLELSSAIAKETETVESWDNYALSLFYMAATGTYRSEQLAYLQRAYEIWSRLVELYPEQPAFAQRRDIVRNYL